MYKIEIYREGYGRPDVWRYPTLTEYRQARRTFRHAAKQARRRFGRRVYGTTIAIQAKGAEK